MFVNFALFKLFEVNYLTDFHSKNSSVIPGDSSAQKNIPFK